jgi:hypothetical protein
MRRLRLLLPTVAACAAFAAGLPATARPAGDDAASPGGHIASCAQINLPPGEHRPAITCEQEGHVHTFANFGEMVLHILEARG